MKLQEVILRGVAASRPASATVPIGTLYYSTDTGVTERNNGSTWDTYTDGVVASQTLPHPFLLMGA